MDIGADTLFAGVAVLISLFSLWFSHLTWIRTNRPIVVAAVEAFGGGNLAIPLNLIVINVGNRPALRVRLHAEKSDIDKLLYSPEDCSVANAIYKCFSEEAQIPLLLDGKSVGNSFGCLSRNKDRSSWIDKSELRIRLTYYDLDEREYVSHVKLAIRGEKGFAGSIWSERSSS